MTRIEDMEIFILDDDQPETCPHCGNRTEFMEIHDIQIHACMNSLCQVVFVGVFE